MADNVVYQNRTPATPAPDVTVAADDVSSVMYQRVKLDLGADGASDPVVLSMPASSESIDATVSRTGSWFGKPAANVYVLGRRQLGWNSTSVLGDAAAYLNTSQDLINPVVAATTYYIVSTSVSDTNTGPGTGAQKVRIVYLDAAGDQQVKEAILNGTGAVSLGSGHSYFQWMEVSAVGSNETSVGQINIGTVNGAQTVASTVDCILAAGNRSLSGRYKVPTGKTAYLIGWDVSAIGTTMDTRLRATVFADDRTLSTVHHFQDTAFLAAGAEHVVDIHYLACPSGSEIKVSAIPGSAPAGNRLDCSFHMIVRNN
jgi:hypothetical protein